MRSAECIRTKPVTVMIESELQPGVNTINKPSCTVAAREFKKQVCCRSIQVSFHHIKSKRLSKSLAYDSLINIQYQGRCQGGGRCHGPLLTLMF